MNVVLIVGAALAVLWMLFLRNSIQNFFKKNNMFLDVLFATILAALPPVLILKIGTKWAFIGSIAVSALAIVIAFVKHKDCKKARVPAQGAFFALIVIAFCAMMFIGANSLIHLAPSDPETLEDEISSYTDEQLIEMFGGPRKFKPTSTLVYLDERTKATGFYDAVTCDFLACNRENGCIAEEELLSNPIFTMGADAALREAGLIGESEWSKTFLAYTTAEKSWYNQVLEKHNDAWWYLTMEYHLIACRYALFLAAAENLGKQPSAVVVKHWPQKPELEKVVESTKSDKFDFYVLKFTSKSGEVNLLGVNVKDGRFAILKEVEATPAKTPTKSSGKKVVATNYTYKLMYDANGGEGPPSADSKTTTEKSCNFSVSATKPTRSGYTFKGWSDSKTGKVQYKAGDSIKLSSGSPTKTLFAVWARNGGGGGGGGTTKKYTKDEEQIPDNQGNAPIGGTGTDGVDDQGPGPFQKNEPVHVDKDKDKSNDTRETIPVDNSTTVDENRPDDKPVEVNHDTDYIDVNGNTKDLDSDPVNTGEVSGF